MEPITREEQFLAKAAGDNVNIPEPITREEVYLKRIAENGGGGGGTSNYEQLSNKPQINDVTLSGDKSADDLGLVTKTELNGKISKISDAVAGDIPVIKAGGTLEDSGVSLYGEKTYPYAPVLNIKNALPVPAVDCKVKVEPIQAGSGTPSPDNIRPISGTDKVKIGVSGKNQLPLTVDGIKAANSGATWTGNSATINGVTFTIQTDDDDDENITGIKVNGTASADTYFTLAENISNHDNHFDGMILNGCPTGGDFNKYALLFTNVTVTAVYDFGGGVTINNDTTGEYQVQIKVANDQNVSNLMFYPMIRLATETDPTFKPYNPNSHIITISLGQTVYCGEIDLVTGHGWLTKVIKSITSATLDQIGTTKCRVVADYDSGLESNYIGTDTYGISNVLDLSYVDTVGFSENSRVYTFLPHEIGILIVLSFTTQSEVDAWIEQNEPTICYELATPIELDITPTTIKLLEGTNIVSANTGDISMTVKYDRIGDLEDRVKALEDA